MVWRFSGVVDSLIFKAIGLVVIIGAAGLVPPAAWAQSVVQTKGEFVDSFRQLEEVLPTPNMYRTGSGAPGPRYWQQAADYQIDVTLDEERHLLTGAQTVTYKNNSPDRLDYLWMLLDQNRFKPDSRFARTLTASEQMQMSFYALRTEVARRQFDGGFVISAVLDADGTPLRHTIEDTLMRIDLAEPLMPGDTVTFNLTWRYRIAEQPVLGGRGGWELFERDGNRIYQLAQWFPRLAAYTDFEGWHNKAFLGRGEFTLEFGDYDVRITVPADHVVSSTGTLANPDAVLTQVQRSRLNEARTADQPVFIVTPEEALANETAGTDETRTWHFQAQNVRDFAFASSRKFIWDAQGFLQKPGQDPVMAMSFYPYEAEPLWSRYSTRAVIHGLKVFSGYTFDYPYPTAQSVNGPVYGMEYPMITFNGPRPYTDANGRTTYSRRTKYALISVIIHEIGHQYFPMIVNSDERQWTWMDEGLTTFMQYVAEQAWEENYPSRRGDPRNITDYMRSDLQVPIMTNSESILQFGNNAYGKPATALNVLRETVMGRELFDFAFKEYARRWKFRRPNPADFFRTMEDASGIDLDWFWRGWFYSTDHVDIAIESVQRARMNTNHPDGNRPWSPLPQAGDAVSVSSGANGAFVLGAGDRPALFDFYDEDGDFAVLPVMRHYYQRFVSTMSEDERALLQANQSFYFLTFNNVGGLVMPVLLQITYTDGTKEDIHIPAEFWRYNPERATKLVVTDKVIESVIVDPRFETGDVDHANNAYPRGATRSRLSAFRQRALEELDGAADPAREMDPKLTGFGPDRSFREDREILFFTVSELDDQPASTPALGPDLMERRVKGHIGGDLQP